MASSASTTIQNAATDRALGIRQSGTFGDPGAAFALQIADTVGFSNFAFTIDLEMLSVQPRSTTWSIEYGIGANPSAFTNLFTYSDPGAFGTTTTPLLTLGADANNLNDNIWIRVVALSGSSNSGNRDTFGIDQFALTWQTASPTLYWDTNGAVGGVGGTGAWDTTTSNWSTAATGDVATGTFSSASPAVFGGTAGTVTITGTGVTATGGLKFESDGYDIAGSPLTLTGSGSINTDTLPTGATTVSAKVSGTAGLMKTGAGILVLSGENDFEGTVNISAGTLQISSAANLGKNTNSINFGSGKLLIAENVELGISQNVTGAAAIEVIAGKIFSVLGTTNAASLTVSGTGTVALNSASPSVGAIAISDAATLSSTGTVSATTITSTNFSGTAVISAPLNLGGANRPVTVTDGLEDIDLALDGPITMTGSAKLQKFGAGTLRLGGDNSRLAAAIQLGQAGGTQTAGGTVVITNKNALGSNSGTQVFFNDGTLRATAPLTGANAIPVGVSIGAGQIGPATFTGADMEFSGASVIFRAAGAYTHQIKVDNTTTFTGGLGVSGAGTSNGLSLLGSGSLVLSGADNAVSIPISVNGPTLVVNSPLSSSAATIDVIQGKLTGGSSIAGNTTIEANAILAPGDGVGTLTFGGDLNIGPAVGIGAEAFKFELGSVAASDRVVLTVGTLLTINGLGGSMGFSDFQFITGAGFGAGVYTLFDTNMPIDPFTALPGVAGGFNATIERSGDGTDIVLNVVPEPGAATLLLIAGTCFGMRRQRRTGERTA